jgi:tRNA U55 pseudouridine synthase TruB
MTINALSASNSVIIPIQCEFFALEGLAQLLNTVKLVRKSINPNLKIRVSVSSGTYIRTLAKDIGTKLNVGAYCSKLRRISIDKWAVDQAKQLSEFGIFD